DAAEHHDLADISGGHSLVDDVGVQARQVERGQRLGELEYADGHQKRPVRLEVAPQYAKEHQVISLSVDFSEGLGVPAAPYRMIEVSWSVVNSAPAFNCGKAVENATRRMI